MSGYGTYDKFTLTESLKDANQTAIAVDAAPGDKAVFTARQPMTVVGFGLEITTTYADMSTAQVVSLDKRPTHNSDTGREELAAITLAVGYADGHVYRKKFTAVELDVGQQLVVEQKVQGAGGGSLAGGCIPFILWYPRAEVAANQSSLHDLT
ncbi:MAG: hypothetical protein QME75_12450 [Deltaproteobacteria bacterium]|nr:hypothetical protein [Deltaproteobacteria bacterium]